MAENKSIDNNISYKIISLNQKVENDKERIKSKFNFNISISSTNSSVFKQSSMPTQENSMIMNNKRNIIKNKFLHLNEKKLNIRNYRPKSSFNIKNNNNMSSNKYMNDSIKNIHSKINELSHKNNKEKIYNQSYENSKDNNNSKKINLKNHLKI